jgi:leucyl-tRNA synthetase
MIFVNDAYKAERLPRKAMNDFLQLLSPIAPHIAEELWERMGHGDTITYEPWPEYDEAWTVDQEIEIVIQVNGKIVDRIKVAADAPEDELERLAKASGRVQELTSGKTVRKTIVVKGKLVNIVAG